MSETSDTLDDGPYAAKASLPPSTPGEVARQGALGYDPTEPGRLGRRTVTGSLWTVLTYLALNVVRLSTNLILTRILARELFGTMLIVNTVMVGIRLFSDVGIGPALISNPRGNEEKFLRTAFTIQVFRGFLIWFVACALAVPVARFYGAHDAEMQGLLLKLLPVAGFSAVLEGLRSTAVFRVQRDLRFGPLSLLEFGEMTFSAIGMVAWAHYIRADVWALLIPPLIGNVLGAIASHVALYHDRHDAFGFDRETSREMMRVGRWIFISTLLTFFASQSDKLIFGKLMSSADAGVYSIAVSLAVMPLNAVLRIGATVLFPTFTRVASQPERFRDVYGRARSMLLTAGATIVCAMIACGPFIIAALYKKDFEDAGWMLQFLAIGAWFQIVDGSNSAALLSHQRPAWIAGSNLVKFVGMVVLVPLAYHLPGADAPMKTKLMCAFTALGLADAARAFISTFAVRRATGDQIRWLAPDTIFPLLIALVGVGGWHLTKWISGINPYDLTGPQPDKWHRVAHFGRPMLLAGAMVLIVWLPICLWQWRRSKRGSTPSGEAPTAAPLIDDDRVKSSAA